LRYVAVDAVVVVVVEAETGLFVVFDRRLMFRLAFFLALPR
jgi:hypothetical protein